MEDRLLIVKDLSVVRLEVDLSKVVYNRVQNTLFQKFDVYKLLHRVIIFVAFG